MQEFVVNRHHRICFPSNFVPELDLSVMQSFEQLDSVIRRDFEVKAPTGTDILHRVEEGVYTSRYELMRDLALNLFWTNRFAITMYEKRPTRWADVPRTRTDVFLPILTPWEDGDRKIAAVQRSYATLPPSWDREVEDRIFGILFDVFGHRKHHATDLPMIKPTVAEMLADPANLTFRLPNYDADFPTYSFTDIVDCSEDVPELEALSRWAMVLHNQYPWDRSQAELVEVGKLSDDDYVVVFHPRDQEVRHFIDASRCPPARAFRVRIAAEAGRATDSSLPAGERPEPLHGDAPHRGSRRGPRRRRLQQRGPDPQRGVQLVTHVGGRDPREDRDRATSLHVPQPRGDRAAGVTGRPRSRRPRARGNRGGAGLHVHEHTDDPLGRDLDLGSIGIFQTHASCDIVAACAGLAYGLSDATRILQEVGRPVLLVCVEKFSDKIGNVRPSRMIFGDGAAAIVVGVAPEGEAPDIEYLQTYASGPVSEVNSIIWPNPAFDNNITVYGPEVKSLAGRYLVQMIDELKVLPDPDGAKACLLESIDLIVPHQANKTMVAELALAAGLSSDSLYFNIEKVGNASSASIPLAIHDAVRDGVIRRPMRIFTPGFGAGAVAGYAVLRIDPAVVALASDPPIGNGASFSEGTEPRRPEPSADDVRLAFG